MVVVGTSELVDSKPVAPCREELLVFHRLFEREFSYVYNTLRRLGVRSMDLDDVTHDTFLKVQRSLSAYDRSRPLRPWLFGVAARAAADYRRLARHRWTGEEAADIIDPAPGPEERASAREALALVAVALQALPIERRAVFILHVLDGCSIPEVAESMEIPVNTAYSRLRLAKEEFVVAMRRCEAKRART